MGEIDRTVTTDASSNLIATEEALERIAIAAGQQAEADRIERVLERPEDTTAAVKRHAWRD